MSTLNPAVEDLIEVGNVAILNSPHVSEGPGRIAKAPVPSIYVDDRGDIHRLRVGGKRMNLLYSKHQVMRSGYFSPHTTHDFIVSGQVEVWTLSNDGTTKTIYGPQQYFCILPYIPHILYFLQDTILVEWYEENIEFQCYYYHPYRKIVDIQNSIIGTTNNSNSNNNNNSSSPNSSPAPDDNNNNNSFENSKTGRHQRLVLEDDISHGSVLQSSSSSTNNQKAKKSQNTFSSTTISIMTSFFTGTSNVLKSSIVLLGTTSVAFIAGMTVGILLHEGIHNNNNGSGGGPNNNNNNNSASGNTKN